MAPPPPLSRLAARPDPEEWSDGEFVTLAEAAALFFPRGPLTAASLRAAHRRGELAAALLCGKLYTTPAEIRRIMAPRLRVGPGARPAEPPPAAAPDRRLADAYRRWRP